VAIIDRSMIVKRAAIFLALLATPALALNRFDAVREQSYRLDSLGTFLERYVGTCRDEFTRSDCEQNVRAVRRGLERRSYTASVAERTIEIVKPERTRSGYRFVVTPFIDGGGIALTHGEPHRQDTAGRPLIGLLVMEGALPEGMDEMALETALRTGRVELEVVFRPEGTWRLKRKGEPGFYEGVRARFLAMRLVESRTGAEIASKILATAAQ
jgi:Family of unknown function (DUF6066)